MSHSTAAATGCIIFLFYSRGHLWSSLYLQLPNRLNAYERRLCVGATNFANSPTYRRIPLTAQHASQFRVAAAWLEPGFAEHHFATWINNDTNMTPHKAEGRKFSGSWRFTNTGDSRKHSMASLLCALSFSSLLVRRSRKANKSKAHGSRSSSSFSMTRAAPMAIFICWKLSKAIPALPGKEPMSRTCRCLLIAELCAGSNPVLSCGLDPPSFSKACP